MSKKKTPIRKQVEQILPEPPKPASASFMRGREAAMKFTNEFCHDELAEALQGFREGVNNHIRENQAKLDQVAEQLIRAEEAINP